MRTFVFLCAFFLPATAGRAQTENDESHAAIVETVNALFAAMSVQFESGRSSLHPSARRALDAVATVLIRYPQLEVQLAGHTDAVGSPASNLRISRQRAETVKAYLVSRHGLDPDRLEVVGLGESFPLAENHDPLGRLINRRVELRVLNSPALPEPDPEPELPLSQEKSGPDVPDLQQLIEEAVERALEESPIEPDTILPAEEELESRLDSLERIVELETAAAPQLSTRPRFALLPLTGLYLTGDLPVIVGLRADIPISLFGSSRFQPEAAVAFTPHRRATLVNANLVIPIRLNPRVAPFFGAGIGFLNIEAFESVLNLVLGSEYRFDFGVLFTEIATQDFGDFNRLSIGYRQDF